MFNSFDMSIVCSMHCTQDTRHCYHAKKDVIISSNVESLC